LYCLKPQFKQLAEVEALESGTVLDTIGVCEGVEGWQMITKKDGTDTRKRSLTIRDNSGRSIEVSGGGRRGRERGKGVSSGQGGKWVCVWRGRVLSGERRVWSGRREERYCTPGPTIMLCGGQPCMSSVDPAPAPAWFPATLRLPNPLLLPPFPCSTHQVTLWGTFVGDLPASC
jgi:hypothetical protein